MDTLVNIVHMKFLVYLHWYISVNISKLKDNYISVDQDRYATSVVEKYLYAEITVSTLDKSRRLGFNIQYHQMVK